MVIKANLATAELWTSSTISHRAKADTKVHTAYQQKLSEEMVEAEKI